jgi:phosphoribosylanthranilate isomerase
VPSDIAKPLVLAGGLTPVNVGQAVAVVRPYAVDVSSGVERSKGIKDPNLIAEFMQAVSSVVR